jgi:hypothetical protein
MRISSCVFRTTDTWSSDKFPSNERNRPHLGACTGIAYCQSITVDDFDQPLHSVEQRKKKSMQKPDRENHDYVMDGRNELREQMILRCTIPNASAVAFRQQIYEKVGSAAVDFPTSGDWMTWINMLMKADPPTSPSLSTPFAGMAGVCALTQSGREGNLSTRAGSSGASWMMSG